MSAATHDAPWPAAYRAALAQVMVAALPLVLARGFYYDWAVHIWFANHIASGIVAEPRNLSSSFATSVIGWILQRRWFLDPRGNGRDRGDRPVTSRRWAPAGRRQPMCLGAPPPVGDSRYQAAIAGTRTRSSCRVLASGAPPSASRRRA